MKQFILSYKDFLNSQKLDETVLTQAQSNKYRNIYVNPKADSLHRKIFGYGERIYLPFDTSLFDISVKSRVRKEIEKLFADANIEIISYEQNQCKKPDNKNIFKIGKLLQDKKHFNNPSLAIEYGEDVSKSLYVEEPTNLMVVFSRNSDDIASMSTKRPWTSCQNLNGGSHKEYVAKDLKAGSIIAYLIRIDDKEISDPEARILIKPFINVKDKNDLVLLPATKVYYRGYDKGIPEKYPGFSKFVMSWVKSVQDNVEGVYKMDSTVYQDGSTEINVKRNLTEEELERVENPKTKEDFELINYHYDIGINYNNLKIDDNGLFEYYGNIYLTNKYFKTLPTFLKNLKSVENLYIRECYDLRTLKELSNLKKVSENLIIQNTKIMDLRGLENLESVGDTFQIYSKNIKNFKGLEKLENIKTLDLHCDNLKSFEGLENCKNIEKIRFVGDGIENFKGLENCDVVGITPGKTFLKFLEYFDRKELIEKLKNPTEPNGFLKAGLLYNIAIYPKNIEMDKDGFITYKADIKLMDMVEELPEFLRKFKSIEGNLICSRNNLTSFAQFENLEEITGKLEIYSDVKTPIDYTGFKNLKKVGMFVSLYGGENTFKSLKGFENVQGDVKEKFNTYSQYKQRLLDIKEDLRESVENPKTKEDWENVKWVYNLQHNIGIEIDSDGLCIIDDSLNINILDNKTIPKFLQKIKELGYINFTGSENLESIENLKNLKIIGSLYFQDCKNLTSLKGLENLETVKSTFDLSGTNVKDFSPLKNLKIINQLRLNNIEEISFKGLENVEIVEVVPKEKNQLYTIFKNPKIEEILENPKTIEDYEKCFNYYGLLYFDESCIEIDEDGLWSYDGDINFYRHEKITEPPTFLKTLKYISGLWFNYCKNLTSLKNLENLEIIDESLELDETAIKDFTDLKSLKSIGRYLSLKNCKKLKSYKGLENVEVGYGIEPYVRNRKFDEWKDSLKNS